MLRANIYSLEPLAPEIRGGVLEGVDMLAGYIGETIATKEYEIRLPLNQQGYVEPGRLALSYLDQSVELHMMAVPLSSGPNSLTMGYAYVGSGCAYVDVSRYSPDSTRATAAHETGHSLGFVTPGAPQEDRSSKFHCCTPDCLMHREEVLRTTLHVAEMGDLQSELDRMLRTSSIRRPMIATREGQKDFCDPCKDDMWYNAAQNVHNLRRNRPVLWNGVV